jgi:soluble lytic murein transglycosylase-like protein/TolA-binding protein
MRRKKQYLATIWVTLHLCFVMTPVFSQTPPELEQKIRADIENRNFPGAIASLAAWQQQDDKVFRLNNYEYLLARLLEKTGDTARAAAGFQAVVKRNSVLSDYALWHLSALAQAQGNLTVERLYLRQIIFLFPDSLVSEAAQMRLAESYFESQDFPSAITALKAARLFPSGPATSSSPVTGALTGNDPRTREALALLGQAYAHNGQRAEARQIYDRLCGDLPNPAMPDDHALAAARGLDTLDGKGGQLDEAVHLRRAAIYQFNRDFAGAREHYKALVKNFPQSTNVPQAIYQIGRGYAQEERFEEALPWFARLQKDFADNPLAADALNQEAAALARMGKAAESVARYQKYIATYPNGDALERAFLNIIDAERDSGDLKNALEWTEKTEEKFSGKVTGALAIFARAKIYISQNDWPMARQSLEQLKQQSDLGGTRVPGGTNKDEVIFLHAYALEQLSQSSDAIDEYLSLADGRNEYYGGRATERLKALRSKPLGAAFLDEKFSRLKAQAETAAQQGHADAARQAAQSALRLTDDQSQISPLTELVRKAYTQLPSYNSPPRLSANNEPPRRPLLKEARRVSEGTDIHRVLADEFLFLDLYDEAAPELETSLRKTSAMTPLPSGAAANLLSDLSPANAELLARVYMKAGLPARATAWSEPFWKKQPADTLTELSQKESLEMLYPAPFRDVLLAEAKPRGVDPRFVLSIMRQESRFQPDIKSYAAARGLMQFITSTADEVAAQLEKKDMLQDELYSPPVAIMFGSQYLKNLFDQFPERPQAVAAAYNGGETNVARWQKRAQTDDPDRFVPEIAYSQSKDYVYKVIANYRMYCLLYDEDLNPRPSSVR